MYVYASAQSSDNANNSIIRVAFSCYAALVVSRLSFVFGLLLLPNQLAS